MINKIPELKFKMNPSFSDENVSIIIVHRNTPDLLNIAIQSIVTITPSTNYEIIVVDNGSDQESQDFLDEISSHVKVIKNKKNEYWSKAANQGVKAADPNSNFYVFMHSDVVILSPHWIDAMITTANGNDSGLVGLQIAQYEIDTQKVDFLQEWCLLVSKKCWELAGPWEEQLELIGHSFLFTLKAQKQSMNPQWMRQPIVHHYGVTATGNGLDVSIAEQQKEIAMERLPKLLQKIPGLRG